MKSLLYVAWAIALLAALGSLYFQYGLHLAPCILCWYQRIAMYPLVILLAVGILRKDTKVYLYVFPLSVSGFFIALYHYLLYIKIIPDTYAPCSTGVSCTTKLIEWFGFINIPFLSFIAFAGINLLLYIYRHANK